MGPTSAPIGTRVASVPEMRSGVQMLAIATTSQIPEISRVNAAHEERGRSGSFG